MIKKIEMSLFFSENRSVSLFSFFTYLCVSFLIAVNGAAVFRSFQQNSDVADHIIRCFVHLKPCLVILAEVHWNLFIVKFWTWIIPGAALWSWDIVKPSNDPKQLVIIGSYMLFACGMVHIVSGLLCFCCVNRSGPQKPVISKQFKDPAEQAFKDPELQEMEKRITEHEKLLRILWVFT